MSTEKNIREAIRWLTTAEDDNDSAVILKENGKFAHSCFHAQQAGEKALKAVWYFADADPWGHSIKKLIEDLNSVDFKLYQRLKSYTRMGMVLDRFYIPTRYPNGLPDITPDVAFTDEDADTCITYSKKIIDEVRSILNS
ncbi:MAG TPA: DNA-binding protein [Desulfobacteraceae bacterium]|nr:DNA-binding protein [Desulfobacteraceae bacterium]